MSEGTEAIRERILDDARTEAEQIVQQAKENAQRILQETEEKIAETRDKRLGEGKRYVQEISARALADTQVEFRRLLSEEKKKLFEETCAIALDRLRGFSETDQYTEKLQDLIVEAGEIIGGGDLLLHLNESDKKKMGVRTLKRIAAKIEEGTHTATSIGMTDIALDSIGGARVTKKTENVSVDNTLEERLRRIKEEKRSEIYRLLFEE